MKIVGMLDTRNDGDFLPEVLNQLKSYDLDALYVYDDGSWDNTAEILKDPIVSKVWNRNQFDQRELDRYLQHRRGFLLEKIKEDFPYQTEDIWVIRIEGDRLFLTQSPREIVERAQQLNQDSRCGVMLDFRRHRGEGWEGVDTFPNWHISLTRLMTWFRLDDVHSAVAFKVSDQINYPSSGRPRPWPRGLKNSDYSEDVRTDMAFFAHYGKRSPKYHSWSLISGNRPASNKRSQEETEEILFRPFCLFPWFSIDHLYNLIRSDILKLSRPLINNPNEKFFLELEKKWIINN